MGLRIGGIEMDASKALKDTENALSNCQMSWIGVQPAPLETAETSLEARCATYAAAPCLAAGTSRSAKDSNMSMKVAATIALCTGGRVEIRPAIHRKVRIAASLRGAEEREPGECAGVPERTTIVG